MDRRRFTTGLPVLAFAIGIAAWLLVRREPLPFYPTMIVAFVVFMLSWFLVRRQRRGDDKHLLVIVVLAASSVVTTPSDARTVDDGRDISIGGFTFDMFGRPIQFVTPDGRVAKWIYKGITNEVTAVQIDGVTRSVVPKPKGGDGTPTAPLTNIIIEVEETAPPGESGPSGGTWEVSGGGGGYTGGGGGIDGGGAFSQTKEQCQLACDVTYGAAMGVCWYMVTDPPVFLACIAGASALYAGCRMSCQALP